MCVEEMKTVGAVEMTLGLMDLSLGVLLHQIPVPFKKDLLGVYIAAVSTTCMGLLLICGGHKPGRSCVRFNTVMHLSLPLFNALAFGFLVRHVPFRQRDSVSLSHYTVVLIGGLLAVLLASFILEVFVSLYLVLTGCAVMIEDTSQQTQVPECSATSDPLCLDPVPEETGGDLKEDV